MKVNINELENILKNDTMNSLYLFFGDEKFLIENNLKKIKKNFGESVKGINYIIIDETNIDSLISNIETPAFGYSQKLIIVKNSGLFKKDLKNKKNNKDSINNIAKYIAKNYDEIKESIVIVFIEENIEINELYKIIEKFGIVCEFEMLSLPNLIQRLKAICNAYKVYCDNDVLKYLIETAGTNMQDLINEIRKLIECVGEKGTITKELIDNLTIKQIQAVIFDLTDNLAIKNVSNSINILNSLIKNKEPSQKILITLYNHFKKLYLVQKSIQSNKDITESLNLKSNQVFLIGKYKKQAQYFKVEDLRCILKELINLDYNSKIGLIDLNIGLEAILCSYCG